MKKKVFSLLLALGFVVINGCSTYTAIDPVGEGKWRIGGSVGGPFFKQFGFPIPIPYLMGEVSYGLQKDMNLTANVHLTSIPFGIGGADLSYAYFPVLNDGAIPTVSIQGTLSVLFNANPNNLQTYGSTIDPNASNRFMIYPIISSAASWKLWIGTIYAGMNLAINTSLLPPFRPVYDANAQWVVVSPFLGYRWDISEQWKFITEVKFQGANVESFQTPAQYVTLNGYATIAAYIGFQVNFK